MVDRLVSCEEDGSLPPLVKGWLDLTYLLASGSGTTVDSVNGRTGAVVLDKGDVGLSAVNNTADAAKTVLAATKLATPRSINGVDFDGTANITVIANDPAKEPAIAAGTATQYWKGTKVWATLDKAAVGLDQVDNTSDATKNSAAATLTNKTISSAMFDGFYDTNAKMLLQISSGGAGVRNWLRLTNAVANPGLDAAGLDDNVSLNLSGKGTGTVNINGVPIVAIANGTTSQYLRGDKTWATLPLVNHRYFLDTQYADPSLIPNPQLGDVWEYPLGGMLFYYDGSTWVRQDQLWGYMAPLNNPIFTGTVAGITKAMVGLGNVDNTADSAKSVASAASAAKLTTPRAINGVNFDGTAPITVGADWGNITSKPTTYPPIIGASGTQAVAGNDPRLVDARTPTAHTHTAANITDLATAVAGKVNGLSGTSQTPAALGLWVGTQADYNALGSWSGSTVYVVT